MVEEILLPKPSRGAEAWARSALPDKVVATERPEGRRRKTRRRHLPWRGEQPCNSLTCVLLEALVAEYVLPGIPAEDLKARAYDLMVAGYESPHLAALVAAERYLTPADLRDLFLRALRDLGASLPDRLSAAHLMKRRFARRVLDGDLAPREGARHIVSLLHELKGELPKLTHFVGDNFGVAQLVGAYYSYDDIRTDEERATRELDDAIVRLCERLARGDCRGCGMCVARARNGPLAHSSLAHVTSVSKPIPPTQFAESKAFSSRRRFCACAGGREPFCRSTTSHWFPP